VWFDRRLGGTKFFGIDVQFTSRLRIWGVLIIMRLTMVMILAFVFLSWDIGKNRGRLTHTFQASLSGLVP
jgi:hypothetical protein